MDDKGFQIRRNAMQNVVNPVNTSNTYKNSKYIPHGIYTDER